MGNKVYQLSAEEQKVNKYSIAAFTCIFGGLFGYSINKNLLLLWALCLIFGGVLLARKYWLIKPAIRVKIAIIELITSITLTIFMLCDITVIPSIIKEAVFFLAFILFLSFYFRKLYEGKLVQKP